MNHPLINDKNGVYSIAVPVFLAPNGFNFTVPQGKFTEYVISAVKGELVRAGCHGVLS